MIRKLATSVFIVLLEFQFFVNSDDVTGVSRNWYKVSSDYIDRFKRQEFQFRAQDMTDVTKQLMNVSRDTTLEGKIPVQIYIHNDHFLQLTNLKNKDMWSTLPYTADNIQNVNQAFILKDWESISSTVKASFIPSTLTKLTLNMTKVTEGTVSSILRRSSSLETLILSRSGDIYASDLSFSSDLRVVDLTDLSLHYAPNVNLQQLKHIKFHYGTFIDPRILREFNLIFNGLKSVALDQTYFDVLKKSLLEIEELNWITIWRLNVALLNQETLLDEILLQSVLGQKLTSPVELVKQDGAWRFIKYVE